MKNYQEEAGKCDPESGEKSDNTNNPRKNRDD